jgi:HEAT repeat protein
MAGFVGAACTVAVSLAGAAPGRPSATQPAATLRSTVEAKLRAYELPPSEKELRALGVGVDAALVEIARDTKVEILVRARAVSALAYAPTPAARAFLERALGDKASSQDAGERLLLRKAAVALGWLGGSRVPTMLERLTTHPDPEVRIDAALALGLTRLESAAEILRRRLPAETDARVRGHVGRQLRVIETALAPADPSPGGKR